MLVDLFIPFSPLGLVWQQELNNLGKKTHHGEIFGWPIPPPRRGEISPNGRMSLLLFGRFFPRGRITNCLFLLFWKIWYICFEKKYKWKITKFMKMSNMWRPASTHHNYVILWIIRDGWCIQKFNWSTINIQASKSIHHNITGHLHSHIQTDNKNSNG